MRFPAVLLATLLLPVTGHAGAAEPLDIVIFGATGEVGTHIVDEALDRGHQVTAVSRTPTDIEKTHPRLDTAKADLLDRDSIVHAVAGSDIVVVSVRGVIGDSGRADSALQFIAAEQLVDILAGMGEDAPRLLHVGGSGSLEVAPGVLFADRLPKFLLPKKLEIEIAGQILALEFYRKVDDVRWTYITPPKHFTNGRRTGTYRIGGDQVLEDRWGRTRLSRADFAVAVIDEAERSAHVRRRMSVAY